MESGSFLHQNPHILISHLVYIYIYNYLTMYVSIYISVSSSPSDLVSTVIISPVCNYLVKKAPMHTDVSLINTLNCLVGAHLRYGQFLTSCSNWCSSSPGLRNNTTEQHVHGYL